MDQRDHPKHGTPWPRFYFMVYEGGELSAGYCCGVIEVDVEISPPAEQSERVTVANMARGWGLYRGVFLARKEGYPARMTTEYYSGASWVVARMLALLHEAAPAGGPYQALPCSCPPEFMRSLGPASPRPDPTRSRRSPSLDGC